MANMSYCKFRNTLAAMRDCEREMNNYDDQDDFSEEEFEARKKLIELCKKIANRFDNENENENDNDNDNENE